MRLLALLFLLGQVPVNLSRAPSVSSAQNDGACVSVTTSSTTALAINNARRGASICASTANTANVFIKLGATATTSDFPLVAGQCFNIGFVSTTYVGKVDAIAASGTQSVCVLELN